LANNDFSVILKAILNKSGIKAELKEIQAIMDKCKISISPTLNTTALRKELKSVSEMITKELNQSFNINLKTNDIFKAYENQVRQISALQKQADRIRYSVDTGSYDTQIIKAQADLQKLGFSAADVNAKLKDVRAAVAAIDTNGDNQVLVADAQKFRLELDKVKNVISQTKIEYDKLNSPVDHKQIALLAKLNKYLRDNTNITAEAREQIQQWINTLSGARVADNTLDNINTDLLQIDANMESLNRKGKSFTDRMKDQFSKIAQFFSISAIISQVISSVRKMKNAVYDIDSAMTNLYKVTDETDTKYQAFFSNSTKNAKALGSTISSLITHASQWAKLGFNLDESEILAKNSMIYANVGEVDDGHAVSDLA